MSARWVRSVTVIAMVCFATSGAYAATTLRLGHTDPADGLRHKAATVFADKVKEYTQGRYTTAARSVTTRNSWSR
jgi:TRAP-type C4-dicarboxylate transport system substrate-binding protein